MTRIEYDHWLKQARFVARQVSPAHLFDDMVAEGLASLATSLRTFDPSKQVGLGTYVLQKMRWAMLDALRIWRSGSRLDSSRGVFYTEVELNQACLDKVGDVALQPTVNTDRIDLDRAVAKMPPKRRRFIRAYLRLGDIALAATEVGISTACGWQLHLQATRTLRLTRLKDLLDT